MKIGDWKMQITVQQEWVFYLLEFCMIACCILLSVVIKKKTFLFD